MIERLDVVEKRRAQLHTAERKHAFLPPALDFGGTELDEDPLGMGDRGDGRQRTHFGLFGGEQ